MFGVSMFDFFEPASNYFSRTSDCVGCMNAEKCPWSKQGVMLGSCFNKVSKIKLTAEEDKALNGRSLHVFHLGRIEDVPALVRQALREVRVGENT